MKNHLVTAFKLFWFHSLDAPLSWTPGAVAPFAPFRTPLSLNVLLMHQSQKSLRQSKIPDFFADR